MKERRILRGLLSWVLAAALFLFVLPQPGRAENAACQRITTMEELVTGRYVLVNPTGYAPGLLAEDWVTAVEPQMEGDSITDTRGAEWILTVESGTAMLTDSAGTTIAPRSDGENGILAGACCWTVSCEDGLFSFHSFSGEEAVTFAANRTEGFKFRAYKDSAIAAGPDSYPSAFALYRLSEAPPQSEEPIILSTVAEAKAAAPGTEDIIIEGSVTLVLDTDVILQDATGGIRLTVPDTEAAPGDVLKITCRKGENSDFSVTAWEITGTAALPAAEVSVGDLLSDSESLTLEYTRVLLKGVLLEDGILISGGSAVAFSSPLPEGVSPGDTADIYAVILQEQGYVLHLTGAFNILSSQPEQRNVLWRCVSPEEISPSDTIAVTMTKDGLTWALSNENGEKRPPNAVEVTVEEDTMRSAAEDTLSWNLEKEGAGYLLHPAGFPDTLLYTLDKNNGVRVGSGRDGLWETEDGYLKHAETGRYLSVYEGAAWRALRDHDGKEASGQSLAFWRLEPPAPTEAVSAVTVDPAGGELRPDQDTVTLSCTAEDASIYYAVSADGETYSEFTLYTQPLSLPEGFGTLYIRAYAAKDGFLNSAETLQVFAEAAPPEVSAGQNAYFGLLHSHTAFSDGEGTVEEAFQYAAKVAGLDFLAVTDHSNAFDNANDGAITLDGTGISAEWSAGKAAAKAATNDTFVGIFGYEMTWVDGYKLGHINTYNTPGWQSRSQEAYASQPTALEAYYKTLVSCPDSISQFNHPGNTYGYFEDFSHYSPEYDRALTLLEVNDEGTDIDCKYFNRALDAGWHVAPTYSQNNHRGSWGDADSGRTVILADALTEEALFDAMASYRVYATEDCDLTVLYELSGSAMGTILAGPVEPEISVELQDPTDSGVCTVEVIADGGTVIAVRTVSTNAAPAVFPAPSGYRYYYLRVTQSDGDVAVTAPVWVDSLEDMGIRSFTTDTAVPLQNQEIQLELELFNEENADFILESLEFSCDGQKIHTVSSPGTVNALGTFSYRFPFTHSGMGVTEFQITVTGTVSGQRRSYTETLTLRYRVQELVTTILVDGSHGNVCVDSLAFLTELASDAHIGVTVFTDKLPKNGNLLLVLPPKTEFDAAFLADVSDFVKSGGSVVLCGQSDAGDETLHTAAELNRLLSAIGSTMTFCDDTAIDKVNNGGVTDALFCTEFNTGAAFCQGISPENVYQQRGGCTVESGGGTWLVKGFSTAYSADFDNDGLGGGEAHVLLACEDTRWGGMVLAAGGPFLTDGQMPRPDNFWDDISANQFFVNKLLKIERMQWPLSTIADVRSGEEGEVYRIQGFATSGTCKTGNTFVRTIYVQDDTGGIAVVPFTDTGIEVGTPMEIIGYRSVRDGNPVLELIGYDIQDADSYRYVPKTVLHNTAMDYEENGGRLMQVEGTVVGFSRTADKKGIIRIRLSDRNGKIAEVFIEDYIVSGSKGVNDLADQVKIGRTVRAIGILHLEANGNPVLRVRNCDEVVYVPPVVTPPTGDGIGIAIAVLAISAAALAEIPRRRKRK